MLITTPENSPILEQLRAERESAASPGVARGGIGTLIEDRKQFDEANALSLLSIAQSVERVAASGGPESIPVTYRELGFASSPRAHMRIEVTKSSRGYGYETSVSVDGDDLDTVRTSVEQLLIDADTIARQEIARRELLDGQAGAVPGNG